ncbi:MAG: fused isobutyryl-CoA mutase/GTPase IcmF [Candidatus Kapaibacteriota bacterium]|jgi:methylmalonyl-CoA mutase
MQSIRVVTAAALFDGHDVSINLFRRLLQKRGAEVINLGHNRSVNEVVTVALQEDVDAILISSYQGGHNEYFKYIVDKLKENNADHILIFGGGGGVILPNEIDILENYGVTRIYHATDGQKIGIDGIADDIIQRIKDTKAEGKPNILNEIDEKLISSNNTKNHYEISRQLTYLEEVKLESSLIENIRNTYQKHNKNQSIVLGFTGTGGSGKSSLIDEIIGRFITFTKDITIGVLAIDPTKSRSQGALLGDRIRYNQIYNDRVYFRSFATRSSENEVNESILDAISVLKSGGFDIIFVETSGIGQANSKVADVTDHSLYVMTAEFGGPSQLDKIDMLDIADFIAINKFEKRGSEDAYREVMINQLRTKKFDIDKTKTLDELEINVYGCSANHFNNAGVNRLFRDLLNLLISKKFREYQLNQDLINLLPTKLERDSGLIDNNRVAYLAEISNTVKAYHEKALSEAELANKVYSLKNTIEIIEDTNLKLILQEQYDNLWSQLAEETRKFLTNIDVKSQTFLQDSTEYEIQGKKINIELFTKSLSGTKIPKVAPPTYRSWFELTRFYYKENFPGEFPFTAGVFPFKRTTEDPKRQFAGEGSPERTNKRFHYLSENDAAKRLSVAFDGITLYAEDPAVQPDIYGKIGEAGVSICTIDDMDVLLGGFEQTHPLTSVSMTINAPAPIMVAFYFMTAYKRELIKLEATENVTAEQRENLKLDTFRKLRGTVQADMLKEDQGQNTIIFSIDFAMKLIGDLQEYLSKNAIKNYYSLSISGYHIAEAGANPITQTAFTLANGFTYVEYFIKRGLNVNDFAPNLSFFFSNGMDPEYSVIGRVARRIWSVAMKNRYNANDKSQRLKYHIQTSGRSLHAQEIDFNDIRTTLQALLAYYDNCNSLHTNSYDEAVTTPTEESVRRSMAIQLILTKEFGLAKNENPNQGSFIIDLLTDWVEEAVLEEFERLSRRGGVLGAMETGYQRSKIQEESMFYEYQKQTGEYPVIGVNTFLAANPTNVYDKMEVIRASEEEKGSRLVTLNAFHEKNKDKAEAALQKVREVAISKGNIFAELLNAVEVCSMGQITKVLYEVGGKYRRGM